MSWLGEAVVTRLACGLATINGRDWRALSPNALSYYRAKARKLLAWLAYYEESGPPAAER